MRENTIPIEQTTSVIRSNIFLSFRLLLPLCALCFWFWAYFYSQSPFRCFPGCFYCVVLALFIITEFFISVLSHNLDFHFSFVCFFSLSTSKCRAQNKIKRYMKNIKNRLKVESFELWFLWNRWNFTTYFTSFGFFSLFSFSFFISPIKLAYHFSFNLRWFSFYVYRCLVCSAMLIAFVLWFFLFILFSLVFKALWKIHLDTNQQISTIMRWNAQKSSVLCWRLKSKYFLITSRLLRDNEMHKRFVLRLPTTVRSNLLKSKNVFFFIPPT